MTTLSRKCKYALRALYLLTRRYNRGPISVSEIATTERIPRKFLETILVQLKNRGIVQSRHGKAGGYYLAQGPDRIMMGAIVRAIDGPLAPLPCASETAYRRCQECVDELGCETRLVMREVRDAVGAILDRTSLAQICERTESRRAESAATYEI